MRALKARVSKLEARQDQRHPSTIATPDGAVSARIYYGKGRTAATVFFDSLARAPEDALTAIGPRLPPGCTLFVLPRPLSPEQWERTYSNVTLH